MSWLNYISKDAKEIYFLGDVFDFWFEYKEVVPKGYIRLLGKLAQLSDDGIKLHFFIGNHDMWLFNYLEKELNASIYQKPILRRIFNHNYFIGHGDGLGPGDRSYKIIKYIFRNRLCQWAFARLHPNFGIGLAKFLSRKSRASTGKNDEVFKGKEKEWLYLYAQEIAKKEKVDYFVFGHRHLPLQLPLESSLYINLGEWMNYCTFAICNQSGMELMEWKDGSVNSYSNPNE